MIDSTSLSIKKEPEELPQLNFEQILELKKCLSSIHNIITYETTLEMLNCLNQMFNFSSEEILEFKERIEVTSSNASGYDIHIDTKKYKILCEVKCNVPNDEKKKYLAHQANSILNDAVKLKYGKSPIKDTNDYYKLIGLIERNKNTDEAINKLLTQ